MNRELRKRKSTIDYSIMDGKRRKEQESESRNTDKLDGDDSDDGGSSFAPSTPGSSRNGTPFDQVSSFLLKWFTTLYVKIQTNKLLLLIVIGCNSFQTLGCSEGLPVLSVLFLRVALA